ncbi:hypothetical protein BLNAU_12559 [Blattamonas nauphoetae]|uniref:Uncharacterized protein n=1 Tax=Blattamonas nauphoetae TaxID=2049346 RepID=A0ABQ9XJ48_9EUKA|nr:hypothetical protein BLNAU_12559 [Blattamonas nauphoetae]
MPPVLVGLFRKINVPAPTLPRAPFQETAAFLFVSGYSCTLTIPSLEPHRRVATYIQTINHSPTNELYFQIQTDEFGGITITDASIGNAWRRMNNTLCDRLPETNKLKHVSQRIGPFVGPLLYGVCVSEIRQMLENVIPASELTLYQSHPLELTRFIMTEYLLEAERMPLPPLSEDHISLICNMPTTDLERSGLTFLRWIWDCHHANHEPLPIPTRTARTLITKMAGNDEEVTSILPSEIQKPSSQLHFPMQISSTLKIIRPGRIVLDKREYHAGGMLYPLEFQSVKSFTSSKIGVDTALYQNDISESPGGAPVFSVVALDGSGIHAQSMTSRGAWENIRQQIHSRLHPRAPQPAICVNGDEMFGLDNPICERLLSLLKYEAERSHKKRNTDKRGRPPKDKSTTPPSPTRVLSEIQPSLPPAPLPQVSARPQVTTTTQNVPQFSRLAGYSTAQDAQPPPPSSQLVQLPVHAPVAQPVAHTPPRLPFQPHPGNHVSVVPQRIVYTSTPLFVDPNTNHSFVLLTSPVRVLLIQVPPSHESDLSLFDQLTTYQQSLMMVAEFDMKTINHVNLSRFTRSLQTLQTLAEERRPTQQDAFWSGYSREELLSPPVTSPQSMSTPFISPPPMDPVPSFPIHDSTNAFVQTPKNSAFLVTPRGSPLLYEWLFATH